ncbi:MAG: AAA family ATPase [Caldilineaceae bacterium SB0661_bin_34]|nr:AAA family ATPase [Caldilineaceae bacterium SB0661_bin_34]
MDNTVETLSIEGLRGFAECQELKLAVPTDNKPGSGLTILVGPNNGGKSTITEALDAVFRSRPVSFSEGKRNKGAGDRISLRLKFTSGGTSELCTVPTGGSQTHRPNGETPPNACFYLPSRRRFNPYFGSSRETRDSYTVNQANTLQGTRNTPLDGFSGRLFKVQQNIEDFNKVMKQVVNPVPEWTIEQSDQGQHYVKLDAGEHHHSSDGLGDGIVSLLFIVDALYDSKPDQLIVIDEPELSLHPAFQRRLAHLFAEYAKDRQIVYATHSPHFVDFKYVVNGAQVARVHKANHRCVVSHLSSETAKSVGRLLRDDHNPHTLGLDAREALFREDGVIVVEGQEDVIFYPKILDQLADRNHLSRCLAEEIRDRLFGWGAGGAGKVRTLLALFRDLGFAQVAAILDGDQRDLMSELQQDFPQYDIHAIPADDVRSKRPRAAQGATCGLLDADRQLKPDFENELAELFSSLPNPGLPESTVTETPCSISTKP